MVEAQLAIQPLFELMQVPDLVYGKDLCLIRQRTVLTESSSRFLGHIKIINLIKLNFEESDDFRQQTQR